MFIINEDFLKSVHDKRSFSASTQIAVTSQRKFARHSSNMNKIIWFCSFLVLEKESPNRYFPHNYSQLEAHISPGKLKFK